MSNIRVSSYVKSSSRNYGMNSVLVELGNVDLYFSYRTVVAFRADGELVVSENDWGPTTGKHLNAIDRGLVNRLPREKFEEKLNEILVKHGLTEPNVG